MSCLVCTPSLAPFSWSRLIKHPPLHLHFAGGILGTIYSTLWDSDIDQVWDREMKLFKQTDGDVFGKNTWGRQFFRAATFVFAMRWLLDYMTKTMDLCKSTLDRIGLPNGDSRRQCWPTQCMRSPPLLHSE